MRTLDVAGKDILLDGRPVRLRGGAMHYFRIHPDYWRDRLLKLRQCGFNTVETYIAWNFHEAREGVFDFEGWRDFGAFLDIASELGLMAVVRPGPYICSEWDHGGLPAWLLAKEGMRPRTMNAPYLDAVERYFAAVLPRLAPRQWMNGGPVVLMQVENEYGSSRTDDGYIAHLAERMRAHGVAVPLFVSDFADANMLRHGSTPDTLLAANCRNHPARHLDVIQSLRPDTPEIVMELWSGVSHSWECAYRLHDPAAVGRDVEALLRRQAHFNIYMFHGGTSFGFMAGALDDHNFYRPFIPSYDTDAPLDEAGNPTPKYFVMQSLIRQHCPDARTDTPTPNPARAYGRVALTERVGLLESLDRLSVPQRASTPETMERFGQNHGFILYRADTSDWAEGIYTLTLERLRDRAQVFVDGVPMGVIHRNDRVQALPVNAGRRLEILVENMGRVNFGRMGDETKGVENICLDGIRLHGWEIFPLPLDPLPPLDFRAGVSVEAYAAPCFHRGVLQTDDPADTWIRIPGGVKGVVWINGFNLGRYWRAGPQHALYLPRPLLRRGGNEVVVLELHGLREAAAESIDHADHDAAVGMAL